MKPTKIKVTCTSSQNLITSCIYNYWPFSWGGGRGGVEAVRGTELDNNIPVHHRSLCLVIYCNSLPHSYVVFKSTLQYSTIL